MSTDTIPARSNGQTIDQTWFNLLRSVLAEGLVPRNTSGVPTAVAGSLGSATYPWLKLFLGAAASNISFEESSSALLINVGTNGGVVTISPTQFKYAINGTTKFLVDTNKIDRTYLGAVGQQVSSSSSTFSTSTTGSFVDVTNLSVSITTQGRPVQLLLVPDASGTQADFTFSHATGVNNGLGQIKFLRGSTEVGLSYMRIHRDISLVSVPVPSIIDVPAAGTYTYKMQVYLTDNGDSPSIAVKQFKLVAFEL